MVCCRVLCAECVGILVTLVVVFFFGVAVSNAGIRNTRCHGVLSVLGLWIQV